MKILILGLHYAPERVGVGVYSSGMAEALAAMGHRVQVIAAQPFYPGWKIMDGYKAWSYTRALENGVEVLRCPHYVPARPSGLKRLLHHLSFAFSALVPTLVCAWRDKPDVVFAVAPLILTAPVARLAAAVGGARSWLHVQDFEVEAAMATGLVDARRRSARLVLAFERMLLGGFDRVSAISPQMCRKLIEKGVAAERVVEFRNWADTDAIRPLSGPSPYRAEWNITTPHVALYSGSIGNKQGIEIVVEAARLLAHRTDLTFVVCGEGPNRARFEALAADLDNVRFHDLQPKARLGELLGLASVHLLPQVAGAADLVLPSKLGNMLASGRPVVATAAPGTGLADEVEGCGIVVPPGDAAALAGGVARALELYPECSPAIRKRAETRWSMKTSTGTLVREFQALEQEASALSVQR